MRLTFQEIRNRAIQFAHDWRDASSERAEAQAIRNEFFAVFGIQRRSVASFGATVKNLGGGYDRIDVIWQGVLIGEHKSREQYFSKAASQAFGYIQSLTRENRDDELPRYVIVSDFARIVLHDLEAEDPSLASVQFDVADLHANIRLFDVLTGIQSRPADPENPINIRAVEVLGQLHDVLGRSGYSGHQLERFLVRILFCLFAEDTGIFEPDSFKLLIEKSGRDGTDLTSYLGPLLDVAMHSCAPSFSTAATRAPRCRIRSPSPGNAIDCLVSKSLFSHHAPAGSPRMTRKVAAAAFALAAFTAGCSSLGKAWLESTKEQYERSVEGMKADMSVMDSDDDGFDAFAPADARHLRAARADMNR